MFLHLLMLLPAKMQALQVKLVLVADGGRLQRYVEDGSYVRLKNITLGYSLPSSVISRIGVKNKSLCEWD